MRDLEKRLALHRAFWNGAPMDEPIVSYRMGDYFFANKFKANEPLLKKGTIVTADMVHVDEYLGDYDRMYRMAEESGQTAFFTAEPCTGFPWHEAMVGCPVMGNVVSFVAEPVFDSIDDIDEIRFDRSDPWFLKYVEFLDKLVSLSGGRFPVGQPIMRGTTDVLGTLIGQAEMACSVITDPDKAKRLFWQAAEMHRGILEEQWQHVPEFEGGYAAGFYHLWAPGKIMWYQEDLSAILSPKHYDLFLKDTGDEICRGYDFTFVHLHPSSFFHLDGILAQPRLKAVQINKDVGGPSVEEMIPVFRRVLDAGKRMIIWGDLSEDELRMLLDRMPHYGLFLNLVAPDVDTAKALNAIAVSAWKK